MNNQEIVSAIKQNIDELINNPSFKDWIKPESKRRPEAGDVIYINNSFVFRDVKTKKNDLYLAIKIVNNKELKVEPYISSPPKLISDFKYFASKPDLSKLIQLDVAVKKQLDSLGELVFILIGHVNDQVVLKTRLSHNIFKKLVWNPKIKTLTHISRGTIIIKDIQNTEASWKLHQ
jgi:hypothetical protein